MRFGADVAAGGGGRGPVSSSEEAVSSAGFVEAGGIVGPTDGLVVGAVDGTVRPATALGALGP